MADQHPTTNPPSVDALADFAHAFHVLEDRVVDALGHLGPWTFTDGTVGLDLPGYRNDKALAGRLQVIVGAPGLVVLTAVEPVEPVVLEVAPCTLHMADATTLVHARMNGHLALLPPGWGGPETRTELLIRLVRAAASTARR